MRFLQTLAERDQQDTTANSPKAPAHTIIENITGTDDDNHWDRIILYFPLAFEWDLCCHSTAQDLPNTKSTLVSMSKRGMPTRHSIPNNN